MAAAFRLNSARAWLAAAALALRRSQPRRVGAGRLPIRSRAASTRPSRSTPAESAGVRHGHAVGHQGDGDRQRRRDHPDRRRPAACACWRSPTAARFRPTRSTALRQQVLRNLIDETLEIQAAKTEKIEIKTVGHRPDRRARRRQRQADARPARRLSRGARLLDQIAAPPDRGRDRLAAAAARQDRERRQRRRRRGQGGARPA